MLESNPRAFSILVPMSTRDMENALLFGGRMINLPFPIMPQVNGSGHLHEAPYFWHFVQAGFVSSHYNWFSIYFLKMLPKQLLTYLNPSSLTSKTTRSWFLMWSSSMKDWLLGHLEHSLPWDGFIARIGCSVWRVRRDFGGKNFAVEHFLVSKTPDTSLLQLFWNAIQQFNMLSEGKKHRHHHVPPIRDAFDFDKCRTAYFCFATPKGT